VRSARQPGSTTGQRARAHAAALEQSFVDQTTMRLATYLGPIARVVANRAAQKASTQDEFVQLVAGHLGAQDRGAFLREIGFDH
jgi:serine/threonine-protein kinase